MFEGFDEGRLALDQSEVYYRKGGSGPPVLLLHGFPQTHAAWHRVAPLLARHYTVVVPDVCGNVSVLGDREERNGPPPDTPTPEPATLALFAGALAALAWFTRQRARRGRASTQVSPGDDKPRR